MGAGSTQDYQDITPITHHMGSIQSFAVLILLAALIMCLLVLVEAGRQRVIALAIPAHQETAEPVDDAPPVHRACEPASDRPYNYEIDLL